MTLRSETRPIFGEESGRLQLPAIIARFADLLPSSTFGSAPFASPTPPPLSSQPPIIAAGSVESPAGDTDIYFTLREQLLISVHEHYQALLSDSGM